MKAIKKKIAKWDADEKKAINMCNKFINVLEKLDGWRKWQSILLVAMIERMQEDKEDAGVIIDTLEMDFNLKVFQIENLAQEMRLEAFLNEIKENPCQLKLIA
jgi:hypothetical protein